MGAQVTDRAGERGERQDGERHRLERHCDQEMHDLRPQHEYAGEARRQDGDQQRAVGGKLAHAGLAALLFHAPDRKRERGGRHQHGRDRRGALAEAVTDCEQSSCSYARHLVDDEARRIEADPAERAADDQRNAVAQRVADDLPVDRPKAIATAKCRYHDQRGDQLRRGVSRKRPLRRLAEQSDQHQAGDKSDRRPKYLLDRVDPDLLLRAGALADIEVEGPGHHIGDGGEEKVCSRARCDDQKQDADDGRALQRNGCQQDRVFGAIEARCVVGVLVASEEAQCILRPPGEKADLQQFVRRRDQRDDAKRVLIDDMRPDDHRQKLEQRSDELRGQIQQSVFQQHRSGSQPAAEPGGGELPDGQQRGSAEEDGQAAANGKAGDGAELMQRGVIAQRHDDEDVPEIDEVAARADSSKQRRAWLEGEQCNAEQR